MANVSSVTIYHKWRKICWAKLLQIPSFHINFHGALRLKHLRVQHHCTKLYIINIYSRKNFHGTLENHEERESLAQKIFPLYSNCEQSMG